MDRCILVCAVLLLCLPEVSAMLIAYDSTRIGKGRPERIAYVLGLLFITCIGNGITFLLLHRFVCIRWNFLRTARDIVSRNYSYQDLNGFALILFGAFLISLALGCLIRGIGGRLSRTGNGALTQKQKLWLYTVSLAVCTASVCVCYTSVSAYGKIVINEVNGNNRSLISSPEGYPYDYIELYNTGTLPCEITKLYLSDDSGDLKKKEIQDCTIEPGDYLLVAMDDGTLSVRKEGKETIYLSDAQGNILDQVTSQAQEENYAYCRSVDGAEEWSLLYGTPGSANGSGRDKLTALVSFSHESGFYEEAFEVEITADAEYPIYYTLDGSIPTASDNVYSGPILVYNRSAEPNAWRSKQNVVTNWLDYAPDETLVDKAFIIRAAAISENGESSEVITAAYFVGMQAYENMDVVSLVADPDDLWGDDGIYVTGAKYDAWYTSGQEGDMPAINYRRDGRASEIGASFSLFSEEVSFSQDVGLRIAGAGSREVPFKHFSIYTRKQYSQNNVLEYDIIGNPLADSVTFRTSDANAIVQRLFQDRDIATLNIRPVAVFLNGEFWYFAYLQEKYDESYFEEHYGIEEKDLVLFKGTLDVGLAQDEALKQELYDFLAQNDLSDAKTYAQLCQMVDVQNYIDYMCINAYIDNMDFSDEKNAIWWRSRGVGSGTYEDGKWRFALYDLDAMEFFDAAYFGLDAQEQKNTFSLGMRFLYDVPLNQQPLFAALKANEAFRQQFVLTFMDLTNTYFRYENVREVMDTYLGESIRTGVLQEGDFHDSFFRNRAQYIVSYLAQEFELTGNLETITVTSSDPEAGRIQVNSITADLTEGSWSGEYYTDYPVTVTAMAEEGFEFVRWEGDLDSEDPTVQLTLSEGGAHIRAVFRKKT